MTPLVYSPVVIQLWKKINKYHQASSFFILLQFIFTKYIDTYLIDKYII